MSLTPPLRVALIGWGAINRTVATLVADRPIDIVAVAVRSLEPERHGLPRGAELITSPSALADLDLDVVAEAAGRESVDPWGHATLRAGADLIISSVSALADEELLTSLRETAAQNAARITISTGALGGVDALGGARLMGIDHVEHRIVKPPPAWSGTPAEQLCDLTSLDAETVFFSDSASQAAIAFPKNANVAMTTALAGIGPEKTQITLVADPSATSNTHEIHAHGAFGTLDVSIANSPLPDNPKSSAMAALNLARALHNRVDTLVL